MLIDRIIRKLIDSMIRKLFNFVQIMTMKMHEILNKLVTGSSQGAGYIYRSTQPKVKVTYHVVPNYSLLVQTFLPVQPNC